MARTLTWIALAAMSAATFALTLVVLFRDRVPRWEGWSAMLCVMAVVALLAYLSGRRALLNEDLRRIDDEIRREDAEERRQGRDPLAG